MNKIISVDWDSIEDCAKLYNMVKCRLTDLRIVKDPTFISRNERVKIVFNSCVEIYETDISVVYKDLNLDEERKYYVYAHCDPGFNIAVKKEGKSTFGAMLGMKYMPFYIGKGCDDRAYDLNRTELHRKIRQKIKRFYSDLEVIILKNNLTEKEALMMESKLIDIFKLKAHGGRLTNLDEGINSSERRKLYEKHLIEIDVLYKNSV